MNSAKRLLTVLASDNAYYKKIRRLFGSSLIGYHPMWDSSGTACQDIVSANNATYGATVPTLASATSPGKKLAPVWSGDTPGSITFGAGTQGVFNGAEGGISLWIKPLASIYTDEAAHRLIRILADANNYIIISLGGAATYLSYTQTIKFGSADHSLVGSYFYRDGWFNLIVTWSASQNLFKSYINGGLMRGDTSLGTWAGVPTTFILSTSNFLYFKGSMSDFMLVNRYITFDEVKKLCDYTGLTKRLSILGDSISNSVTGETWPAIMRAGYTESSIGLIGHAVSGQNIITNMDAQTVASESDDADIIIIALGTNDDNAGNMTTLQAEYEENIAELKVSNPRATIYSMNVLPVWADATTGAEIDKSNIRTAIAAACTAQGITCWDTFTDPWIAQDETSDGVHPTAAGHAKIAAEVLARLA
jgi:lysophospholipase L1-like esterase